MSETTQDQQVTSVAGQDTKYTVQTGDSLAKIAEVYYGSQEHWNKIYQANTEMIGSNPHEIQVGLVLDIPA